MSRILSKYLIVFLLFSLTGCSTFITRQDPSIRETQIELNVQQTLAAQQSTRQNSIGISQNQEGTLQAQSAVETQSAHLTSPTLEATPVETIPPPPQETPVEITEIPQNIPTLPVGDFENWMKSANILLYEDMIGYPNTNRYAKDTLAEMGIECSQKGDLPCRDVGSAQGWFRDALKSGGLDGKPWDLVIIASELKSGVNELKSSLPNDFYGLALGLIDQGTPVILELGDLDRSYSASARNLLERCGISFENNWVRIPSARMVMFPLVDSNPILQEPNPNLSFSDVTSLWTTKVKKQFYDLGDLVKLSPSSDATLLLGTVDSEPGSHGTLTSCMDGMLLLQTFSSHQLTYNSMKFVWENYLYNQLKRRYSNLQ